MGADSPASRLLAALELADMGVSLMRENLRRANPDASAASIEQLLRDWLAERPGARWGDSAGVGRPVASS